MSNEEKKAKPIYVVTHLPTKTQRLVRANNQNGAVRHVSNDTLSVRRPTQDELITLAGAGVKVEESVES